MNPSIRDWQHKRVWLIGASSGIGAALARELHRAGAQVWVSARSLSTLTQLTQDYPGMQHLVLDVLQPSAWHKAIESIQAQLTASGAAELDLVLYCAGTYAPLRATAYDRAVMQQHMAVNYGGVLELLHYVLPRTEAEQAPAILPVRHLSFVSSVAGFRALPRALAYGPSKAALSHLAEALYVDLKASKIAVSVIHPGFVATPLTAQNSFEMPALITPEVAAQAIVAGWRRGQFEIHFPRRFTYFVKLLRFLPRWLYVALMNRIA